MSIDVVLSDNHLPTGRMEITFMESITVEAEITVDVQSGDAVIRIPLKENDEAFREKVEACLQNAADEI